MTRLPWIAAFVLFGLAGCATPAQRAQARLMHARAACENYGFTPNTAAFSNCVMRADLAAQARQSERRAAEDSVPILIDPRR